MPFENNHDETAKTLLLGTTLPAGQTAEQDLAGALDDIFNHPNVAPFVSKQLIQHLVTSNPSTAYVKRVADVFASGSFNGFGSGQRGDLQAVIAAILLDPEARENDDPTQAATTGGHLREPILYLTDLLRAFGATSDGAAPVNYATNLSQAPLRSPSVFNFFPPDYQIPGTTLTGPNSICRPRGQRWSRSTSSIHSFTARSEAGRRWASPRLRTWPETRGNWWMR